ncbi:MAG: hypothetical protein GVY28_13490, partial [Alphaproteobacteria bacterium]|nr:hypothetical protein [Alphaproteobacteria bacterium]
MTDTSQTDSEPVSLLSADQRDFTSGAWFYSGAWSVVDADTITETAESKDPLALR